MPRTPGWTLVRCPHIVPDEGELGCGDGSGEIAVAVGMLHKIRVIKFVDCPHVDRSARLVQGHEPIVLPLTEADKEPGDLWLLQSNVM